MLAVVKTPHIELSINGTGAQEALEWLGRKCSIHVITDETKGESVDIGETAFYREMVVNFISFENKKSPETLICCGFQGF